MSRSGSSAGGPPSATAARRRTALLPAAVLLASGLAAGIPAAAGAAPSPSSATRAASAPAAAPEGPDPARAETDAPVAGGNGEETEPVGREESPRENLPPPRPRARAVRVPTAPVLDGDVLDEPLWQVAPPVTGFWQTRPNEGRPSSQETEVRIVFTDEALYFGVVCRDTDPDGIIVADTRRDSSLSETDSFLIVLDPHRDRQNGWVFGTSPSGLQYDGQVTRNGQGSGGGFNLNWDGTWEVEARLIPEGWSAEFAIPFRTLRYPSGTPEAWGMNLQRNIRRRNEDAYWAPLPRQFELVRVSLAGDLTGVEPPRQRNFKVTPYALGERSRAGDAGADTVTTGEVGVDAKYSLTPSLTLDVTYNTDFAQVEADFQQVNLTRFNLFFPEKRPFFLENAGFFQVGQEARTDLFFSRRIGLDDDGNVVPILGGVRVSGKAGRTNIGFLDMQTEGAGAVEPNNWGVVRVNRELANRSQFGGIFTNRQGTGDQAFEDGFNRAYALDGRKGIGDYGDVYGFAARSVTPGLSGRQHAVHGGTSYNSEKWLLSLEYTEVGEDFNPEMGFLRRRGYRSPDALIFRRWRPEKLWGLQELRPHISYRGFWDFDSFQETGFLHVDNHWEWKNGNEVHTGVNFTTEGLKEEFEIFPGVVIPPGTYRHSEAQLLGWTNRGAPFGFELETVIGGFFGGERVSVTPTLRVRTGERFNTEVSWQHNNVNLPGGDFETNLGRLRLSYSFSPRSFVQALVQYNDRDDIWSTNLRWAWLQTANVGFWVVYNQVEGIGTGGPPQADRSLIVKTSWQFDLLR